MSQICVEKYNPPDGKRSFHVLFVAILQEVGFAEIMQVPVVDILLLPIAAALLFMALACCSASRRNVIPCLAKKPRSVEN